MSRYGYKEIFDGIPLSGEQKELYQYYRSLGYDRKTAAVLAVYTFGSDYSHGEKESIPMDVLYKVFVRRRDEDDEDLGDMIRDTGSEAESEKGSFTGFSVPTGFPEGGGYRTGRRVHQCIADTEESASPASSAEIASSSLEAGLISQMFSGEAFPDAHVERKSLEVPSFLRSGSSRGRSLKASAVKRMPVTGAPLAMPATDEYEPIEEKDFRNTASQMTSTFRMTTNTASAGIIFNQLREERRIDRSMVRIEEMLNYFRYRSSVPEKDKFRISCELMPKAEGHKLLYINVQGKEEIRPQQNIVLLLDVSGSMRRNTVEVQAMVATILSKLKDGDKLSLVTYSARDRVLFRGMKIRDEKDRIRALETLLAVGVWGCTHGSAGIETAYQIGKEEFIEGGNNQVILITDGDLNFGITDKGGLAELIEEKKKTDLFLSVVGTGIHNFRDDKLETLCKHGNGVYRVVNNLADVKKCVNTEYASLVNVIAKDVKAQVEFNPEVVESFRLLGFENREISHQDFTDDKVISEPFGSGGYGVALYELVLRDGSGPVESGYKYARVVTTGSKELGTVKIRYKEPLADTSEEIEYVIPSAEDGFTDNLRLAYVVYVCAEKLRGSDKIGREDLELAEKLCDTLGEEIREINKDDFYKLPEILKRSARDLNVGIHSRDPFEW